jgi:hypothetical protein
MTLSTPKSGGSGSASFDTTGSTFDITTAGATFVVYSPGINYGEKISDLQAASRANVAKLVDGIYVFTTN